MHSLQSITESVNAFFETSPDKFVPRGGLYAAGIEGMPMFAAPLLGAAAADDPLFEELKKPHIVGAHHCSPDWWLPGARSVISVFLPFSPEVRAANRQNTDWPADAWYHARIEGHRFAVETAFHIADLLARDGWHSVVPDGRSLPERADPRFHMGADIPTPEGPLRLRFTSNWSERHAAYICGLGTFSLTRSLITEKGCAGRFCSVVTDLPLEPTPRAYRTFDEYCVRCGACVRRCPAGAVTLEGGKDQAKCKAFLDRTRVDPPYYGCGKCQVGVPCETGIPGVGGAPRK